MEIKSKKGKWGGRRPGAGRPNNSETRKMNQAINKMPSENRLQKSNICEIIELCQRKGVSKLKFNGLKIEFFQGREEFNLSEKKQDLTNAKDLSGPIDSVAEELSAAQRMIDDPAGYERDIIASHLR